MGKDLTNERISTSYKRLLQIDPDDNTSIIDGTGSKVVNVAFPTRAIMSINADTTFTSADSGKIITITHASNGTTHELPAVADCVGCEFEFIMQVSRTADVKFDSQGNDNIRGFSVNYAATGETTGSYITDRYIIYDESLGAGTNGQIGDRMKLTCDGTFYYIDAYGVVLPAGTEPKWSGSST